VKIDIFRQPLIHTTLFRIEKIGNFECEF